MRIASHYKLTTPPLNVTPLIDIVFLLIAFFMLVSEISRQDQLEIQPPRTQANQALDEPALIITVLHDGTYCAGGEAIDLVRLASILEVERRLNPHAEVLIRADRRAHYRHVRAILRLCTQRQIAIPNIAFYTQPLGA